MAWERNFYDGKTAYHVIRSLTWNISVALLIETGADGWAVEMALKYDDFSVRDNKPVTPFDDQFDAMLIGDGPVDLALELLEIWRSHEEDSGVKFTDEG